MNVTEQRAATAMRQVADGVVVTDVDLDRLEADLMDRIHHRRAPAPRYTPWQWAVAACAALGVVLGGLALWVDRPEPAPPAEPRLQISDLVGLWREDLVGSSWLWEFHSDGTMGFAQSPGGYLSGGPAEGRFVIRGRTFTFSTPGGSCPEVYTVAFSSPADMEAKAERRDGCSQYEGMVFRLTRISPLAKAATKIVPLQQSRTSRPVTEVMQLKGSWLQPATGALLVIGQRPTSREVEYLRDDDGDGGVDPDERGTVVLGRNGSVELRPAEGYWPRCSTVYSKSTTDNSTLTGVVTAYGCAVGHGGTVTWLRLN